MKIYYFETILLEGLKYIFIIREYSTYKHINIFFSILIMINRKREKMTKHYDNMKKDKLKDFTEHILEKAKSLLLVSGKLVPVAFLHYNDNIDVIGLSFKDNEEKEIQFSFLKKLVEDKNAEAIFIVVESWYVITDKDKLSIEPSKHPLKKECLLLYGESEDRRITIVQFFEKKNGEIIFGEKINDVSMNFNFGIYRKRKQNKDLCYLN